MNNKPCGPGCDNHSCECALVFDDMRLVPHEEVIAVMMQDPDYRKAHRIQQPAFDLSNQLYKRRKEIGVVLAEQIAEACALPVSVIQKAFQAEGVKLVTLARIAEALGCHIKIELVPNDSLPKEEGGEK